jgi:hypothetical protein
MVNESTGATRRAFRLSFADDGPNYIRSPRTVVFVCFHNRSCRLWLREKRLLLIDILIALRVIRFCVTVVATVVFRKAETICLTANANSRLVDWITWLAPFGRVDLVLVRRPRLGEKEQSHDYNWG